MRTQSGAEVDFVLYKNDACVIPIEIKFKKMKDCTLSRSFRSFVEAYRPSFGFYVTKNFNKKIMLNDCEVHFISLANLADLFKQLKKIL